MGLCRIKIENFKSIKFCDISTAGINLFIGPNGSGKTTILEAIEYFFSNLTEDNLLEDIYDHNNRFCNELKITLTFDLRNLCKIAKVNLERVENNSYIGYYQTIINIANYAPKYQISITLSQVKGGKITWNYLYKERQLLKSLFPVYYIDVRNLNINEWDYAWELLGELGKVSNRDQKELQNQIDKILHSNMKEKIDSIDRILKKSDITIKRGKPRDFAKNLAQLYYCGKVMEQKGKKLKFYSTGTSSLLYIGVLLDTISCISKTKMKEPIVLLDEPELSLHPQYIDELAEKIYEKDIDTSIFLSTHSPRLIKKLILEEQNIKIYSVKKESNYTNLSSLRNFKEYSPRSIPRVNDEHINAYFAQRILFVEGESELEFFNNPFVRELFPILKRTDVYKAVSQNPELEIMNPNKIKAKTPYIILIDMDKALKYNRDKNSLAPGEYLPEIGKESFFVCSKKNINGNMLIEYKRLFEMVNKLKLHQNLPLYSCTDVNYYQLINSLHQYLLYYNVFTFTTTIEGAIINKRNYNFILEFLKGRCKENIFTDLVTYIDALQDNDKINLLRLVFHGKTDLWQDEKKLQFPGQDQVKNAMKKNYKASGWISEMIEMFFKCETKTESNFSLKKFKSYINNSVGNEEMKHTFRYNFPEMYEIIERLTQI